MSTYASSAARVLLVWTLLASCTGKANSSRGNVAAPTSSPCVGVPVTGEANLAVVVGRHGPGTTYCLAAGDYTVSTRPTLQPGDVLWGAGLGKTVITAAPKIGLMFEYNSDSSGLITFEHLSIGGAYVDPNSTTCNDSCGVVIIQSVRVYANDIRCFGNGTTCMGGGIHDSVFDGIECDGNGWHPDSLRNDYQSASCLKFNASGSFVVKNSYIHDNYWDGIWCDYCDSGTLTLTNNRFIHNGRSGIVWEVSGDAAPGDHAYIKNNVIQNNGWNTNAPPTGWAGVIISDSANVEIVGNTFGGNNVGDGSGGTRAVFIYDGTRDPLPMHDIYIHDNVLNGDRIQSGTSTGVTCG
jgi:Right handed beta helix region